MTSESYGVCISLDEFRALRPEDREKLLTGLIPLGIAVPREALRRWLDLSDPNEGIDDICFTVTMPEQAAALKGLLRSVGIASARLHKFDGISD